MKKNYVLSIAFLLICNTLVFGKIGIGNPVKAAVFECFEAPELTVLHPSCESPLTGTISVDSPLGDNYLYSIDGVNYQENRHFYDVLPGIYQVTYKDGSGCTSEAYLAPVYDAVLFATLDLSPESSLSQNVCINTDLVPIVYTLGGTATQVWVSGLPAGVAAVLSDGILTISGTPSASGTYNFSITTDGACPASSAGTIFVKLNVALVWISSSGSKNQTVCSDTSIVPIKHIVANGGTGAVADGLPAGISGLFSGGVYTLSGTPAEAGNYNYTVTTVGGCSVAVSTGTLIVNPSAELNLQCNNEVLDPLAMKFDWDPVLGAATYHYSYSIDSGPLVSGNVSNTSEFTVNNVFAGQSVVFTIDAASGVQCLSPQSVTCTQELLGNEVFESDAFGYFPNPVQDILQIHAKDLIKTISVFDMLGQKVMEKPGVNHMEMLDVSRLPKGVYLVFVASDHAAKTIRIVKE